MIIQRLSFGINFFYNALVIDYENYFIYDLLRRIEAFIWEIILSLHYVNRDTFALFLAIKEETFARFEEVFRYVISCVILYLLSYFDI